MQGQNNRSVPLNQPLRNPVPKWPGSRPDSFKKSDLFLLGLAFILLLAFSIHSFDSIGQDIGRHLKIGEIIWQTKHIPKTNLFSFTEPNFPFINHHWLSEAIFYKIYDFFGFTGLIWMKVILILTAFLFLFSAVKKKVKFWPVLISFLLSVFVFIHRAEARPEIFSFVILSLFLFVLFKEKLNQPEMQGNTRLFPKLDQYNQVIKTSERAGFVHRSLWRSLWFLPLLELLWVNLHIYFFIGPFLVGAFLLDYLVNKSAVHPLEDSRAKSRGSKAGGAADLLKVWLVFLLTLAATLANPAGLHGALAPFTILKEYGYSIVENQTLSFLSVFTNLRWTIFAFKLAAGILTAAFLLTIKKIRQRAFEVVISIFFIYAGFKMLRNLPLYALGSFPILSFLLTDINDWVENKWSGFSRAKFNFGQKLSLVFKWAAASFLVFMIFFVASNRYYGAIQSSKAFGFSVPNGLERATNFVKENKIEGPMFNNFDIGGYLIWKLFPQEKVFVDNRPEAYSVEFFSEIYKPMQEDKKKWAEFSEQYGINFIFFGHTDATPWGQAFLKNIVKDPAWKMVYLNENAIVFLKDTKANALTISHLAFSEKNSVEKTAKFLKDANGNKADVNLVLSRFFYNINWRQSSLYFSEEAIKADPKNQQAHLNKGLNHAYYTDRENQKLAAESIKKAIDLGLKNSQYYSILGIIYLNLEELAEAKDWLTRALELDKNNAQAKEFLNRFFK